MSKPYICPVCDGRGSMPPGFYDSAIALNSTQREPCRTCNGTGIVWTSEDSGWQRDYGPPKTTGG